MLTNLIRHVLAIVRRDLRLAMRHRADVLGTLFFFIIVVSLFPLGIGPEKALLRAIAPGVLWVAALLATMLSLNRLFASDYADGTLEQLILAPQPLALTTLAKILALWITTGLPLVILAPILGLQFDLPAEALWAMTLALLLGTPIIAALGAIGAGLTLGLRGGVLLALLVLPLYIPVLIFGAGAVDAVIHGLNPNAQLSLLAAGLIVSIVFSPWASAVALRIALD
ncbi:MAG: heme exporter protein CcmB [Burkholderiales bacterium]